MKPRRMIAAVPIAFCLVAPLGWGGCTERPEEQAPAKAAPAPGGGLAAEDAGRADGDDSMAPLVLIPVPFEVGPEWIVETGTTDSRDLYSAAVVVYAKEKMRRKVTVCTGVLVSPRLALTAANCVCLPPRKAARSDGGQRVIDDKACVTMASASVSLQDPRTRGAVSEKELVYDGPVRVHPAFKQVLDEQGDVVSSEADLAVIRLDRAPKVAPVALAESDVKPGESLVVVGYGYLPGSDTWGVERRFSEHPVTQVLDSGGRITFAQPSPFIYKGARGGPCLRRTRQGMRLAGIFSTTDGKEASFTRTYAYRDWLSAEMAGAADAGVATPPGSLPPVRSP